MVPLTHLMPFANLPNAVMINTHHPFVPIRQINGKLSKTSVVETERLVIVSLELGNQVKLCGVVAFPCYTPSP